MPRALLAAALLLMLLASPVAAQQTALAQTKLVTSEDATGIQGGAAFLLLPAQHPQDNPLATLTAGEVAVTVRSYTWQAGLDSTDMTRSPDPDRTGIVHGVAGAFDFSLDHALAVAPLPGQSAPRLEVAAHCIRLAPEAKASANAPDFIGIGPSEETVSLANAVQLTVCSAATATLRGDFRLTLWSTNATLLGSGNPGTYPSGRAVTYSTPAHVCPGPCTVSKRQAVLDVHDGNLTLAGFSFATAQVDAQAVTVTASNLDLHVDGMVASGAVTAKAASDGKTLTVHVAADQVRGGSVSPANAATVASAGGAWPWMAGLAALVLIHGFAAAGRWRPISVPDLELLLRHGQYGLVARHARPAWRGSATRRDARVLLVQALAHLGRADDARRQLPRIAPPTSPTSSFLRAYLHAVAGDAKSSASELLRCLPASPELRAEVAGNPVFRRAVRDGRVAELLASQPQGYS